MCVNTTEAHQKAETKPGQCPKPWLGEEGLCDRRGDMCQKDFDCKGSQICCFNGCQKDCVNPGQFAFNHVLVCSVTNYSDTLRHLLLLTCRKKIYVLAIETKDSFVLWLAKFEYQNTCL